jgi:hypothetical protein
MAEVRVVVVDLVVAAEAVVMARARVVVAMMAEVRVVLVVVAVVHHQVGKEDSVACRPHPR